MKEQPDTAIADSSKHTDSLFIVVALSEERPHALLVVFIAKIKNLKDYLILKLNPAGGLVA